MTKRILAKAFIISSCLFSFNSHAADRPDAHAPIGVKRDHVHKKGEYMLSYRFNFMKMKGLRKENDRITPSAALKEYKMAPLHMNMRMHAAGAMYGISDNFTISAMSSIIEKEMRSVNRMNQVSDKRASGFGDSMVNLAYAFLNNKNNNAQFNLGTSIPTGSIKKTSNNSRLSYPMQLGSGSYEILPGISYTAYQNSFSYGGQLNAIFRVNDNNLGYRLGDSYNATSWISKKLNNSFSVSSRLNYTMNKKIKGSDASLNPTMLPPNNVVSHAAKKLDFLIGTNYIISKGKLEGHRLAIEAGAPIYQSYNAVRAEEDYKITLGWQKAF